jgi:hypothetical protein
VTIQDRPAGSGTNDHFRYQVVLLIFLLIFYCAPHIIIFSGAVYAIVTSPSHKVDEGILISVVRELGTHTGLYTNSIHQMILPAVAAITAASSDKIRPQGLSNWLFILPLVTIFVCLADTLIFNIRSVLEPSVLNTVSQYFVGSASNLAVYVMLLVGLQAKQPA